MFQQFLLVDNVKHGVTNGTQLTGLSPHVLKYSIPVAAKLLAISLVVMTADIGCPFPIGLPTPLKNKLLKILIWRKLEANSVSLTLYIHARLVIVPIKLIFPILYNISYY